MLLRALWLITTFACFASTASAQIKPRIMIAVDTSGSMAGDLSANEVPTWGDGITDGCMLVGGRYCGPNCAAGIDTNCDGLVNDSRMYVARDAIRNMVLAFGDVDWGLSRFHQSMGANITCTDSNPDTNINNYECNILGPFITSYGNPQCNTGAVIPSAGPFGTCPFDWPSIFPAACAPGSGGRPALRTYAAGTSPLVCGNYRGDCAMTGDILVGFNGLAPFATVDNGSAIVKWVDHRESNFNAGTTAGNFCNHAGTGDCELRPEGPTPLGFLLDANRAYLTPIRTADPARMCRPYSVILITDGVESCGGDAVGAANTMRIAGINTYVVGMLITPAGRTQLNSIATAGGTDAGAPGGDTAFFADDPTTLSAGLADIVRRSLLIETCNNVDDDCDSLIDEGFTKYCNRPGTPTATLCADPGETRCDGIDDNCNGLIDEGRLNACGTCGTVPAEVCDGVDNDCDGAIDEISCPCVPMPETCNNVDQDCDGRIDEGVSRPCGTDVGECTTGTQICVAGVFGMCSGRGPVDEICNNRDDDCDGITDGLTRPCGTDVGECRSGIETCTMGAFGMCVGSIGPTAEVCDAEDDDCDTRIDEMSPGTGAMCGSGIGECTPGTTRCTGGMLVCGGGVGPMAETCNALDDDCDGAIDDGIPTMGPCGMSEGECEPGVRACVMGAFMCTGGRGPRPEMCNGADDDCDTRVDEGTDTGATCGSDIGECTAGMFRCVGGVPMCVGSVGPTMEICNSLDDDCDGAVDDGLGVGAPCGSDIGECVPGMTVCSGGAPMCMGEIGPIDELCDLLDNDCDGTIDEDVPMGGACGSDVGLCMPGVEECVDGVRRCVGEVPPMREACDCEDNDCDGAVDDPPDMGSLCPAPSACIDCQCALPCVETEFGVDCPTGRAPVTRDGACWCVAELCDDEDCATQTVEVDGVTRCGPDERLVGECVCRENECTFPCNGVVCPEGLVCDPRDPAGRCVADDCRAIGCEEGLRCDFETGECETDPCASAGCAADEVCRDGTCEMSCADVTCAAGERCRSGACEADPCATVECTGGRICIEGTCGDDMCRGVSCAAGEVCDRATGDCIADPCNVVVCPAGQECDGGECVADVPEPDAGPPVRMDAGRPTGPEAELIVATGGGGCVCTVGAAPSRTPFGAVLAMLGIGLVLVMRRGRRRLRTFLIAGVAAVVGVLGSGCDVEPFCTNCLDAGTMDAGGDARVMYDAPLPDRVFEDTGPVDAGLPDGCPGLPETCNEFDDDCDMLVDETFDTAIDPENCGGCGMLCAPAHAFGTCTDGECGIGSCDVGWYDLDGMLENGCEYGRCLPTQADDTLCDLRDTDCDGTVDEDVAFETDPDNCGSCGRACRFAHAAGSCAAGDCVLGACEDGFFDVDGMDFNGCEYSCMPSGPELCNNRDDDCNGEIDEGDPGGGARCGSDTGECTAGVERCVMGVVVCMGGVSGSDETCDGRDEDCDGTIDDGNPEGGGICGTDVGECNPGINTCTGGRIVCMGETMATMETCDGQDDDCDGSIDDGNPGGGGACGTDVGECRAGTNNCLGGTIQCMGSIGPALETCNMRDDDCNGTSDDGFNLMTDVRNCGMCGMVCSFPNSIEQCMGGTCRILACEPGFFDRDGLMATGCEYMCDFAGTEVCNGSDDDCDGMTDEGLTPPAMFCNPNGVCAGTVPTCTGAGGWVCNYPPATYEAAETRCDGRDNDCDGMIDEPFPTRGMSCGGGVGECRRTGMLVCNMAGTGLVCNAPPVGSPASEACDNLDNDCDGLIDERGVDDAGTPYRDAIDVNAIPTVTVPRMGGGTVRVMQYEASRPDATSTSAGTVGTLACSNPNVLPWADVRWTQARDACCALNVGGACGATGWRLCDSAEWQTACRSSAGTCNWSYSSACTTSTPTRCNGDEYDADPGMAGDQDRVFPTGSATFPECRSTWAGGTSAWDMSGNVKEWTNTAPTGTTHEIRGGSYNNLEGGRTCTFNFTVGDNLFSFPNTGFRCCFY